jgi:hypothetical protein
MNFPEIRALFDLGATNHGIAAQELDAAETRLRLTLPPLLRAYYTELGAHEALNHTQDHLLSPAELRISETGTHLVFYAENQWVCAWALALADLHQPDPPVWISYDDGALQADTPLWQPEAATLKHFLLAMTHQQALFAFPYAANAVDISPKVEAQVRTTWPVLPVALSLWSVTYLQAAPNHLLALMGNVGNVGNPGEPTTDLFVAAKTKEALTEVLNKLDVKWEYNSLDED